MKKKIAFYIESMVVGGAERVLIDTVNHLDYSKYDVTVISIFKNSVYSDYTAKFSDLFNEQIHYKWLIDNGNKFRYTLFNYTYAHLNKAMIYSRLIKESYDIEIAYYEGLPTEFVAHSTQGSKKIAWLHTDNNFIYKDSKKETIEHMNEIYEKYDCIVAVSDVVKKSFNRYFEKLQVVTIYNYMDIGAILTKGNIPLENFKTSKTILLSVGRLIPLKGYLSMINVANKLIEKGFDFEYWIVGDGMERGKIELKIKEFGLQKYIKILGYQDNPYKYMKNADIFVCSSAYEGFSLTLAEAMICECAVVSTRCSGPEELLDNGKYGLLVDNNEDALYHGIKELLSDQSLLNRYKECSKERIAFFRGDTIMEQLENLFSKGNNMRCYE